MPELLRLKSGQASRFEIGYRSSPTGQISLEIVGTSDLEAPQRRQTMLADDSRRVNPLALRIS